MSAVPWAEEALLRHLRRAADNGRLSARGYERYYYSTPGAPSPRTFLLRWGTWNTAARAAGLRTNPPPRPRYDSISPDACMRAIAQAGYPTLLRYIAFREQHPELGLPGAATIRARFGGWPSAIRAAREAVGSDG